MLILDVKLNEAQANLINIALDTLLAANQQRLQFAGGVSIVSAILREALEKAQQKAASDEVASKPAEADRGSVQAITTPRGQSSNGAHGSQPPTPAPT